ncbi:Amino acid permease [Aspergillus sp. HF37]|nr:Amino acid permease [Aspergillus sp. HF37]
MSAIDQIPDTKKATPEAGLDGTIEIGVGDQEEQKPQKAFTMLSAASLGYSICNTPVAMLLVMGNSVFGGGPLFFYGTLLIVVVSLSVAISLGELASAYPHAGGQYFYVAQLAPPKYRRYISYMTGIISWASVVCIGASSCSGTTGMAFQLVAIKYPTFEYHQWQGFLVFQAANLAAFFFNFFERFIPVLGKAFLCLSIVTGLTFFCTLLAAHSPKQSARGFFVEYYNTSGWPDGVAFFIGISGINWGFSCLDAVTHLSEEIPAPRKNIPKALLTTVAIGAVTGLTTIFAIFFAAYDLPSTSSVIQLLDHIYNGYPIPGLVLGSILLTSTWASLIGIHTWQARIAWSLSRDKGLPFNSYLSRLAPPPFSVPLWAHLWSTAWISLCGFLYLGSLTAFNSFISAGIVLQYMTYSAPIVFLLLKGRKNFVHGPFFLPKIGLAANIILLCWTLITTVFYCFPLYLPVVANEMNYLSVVMVLAFLYALAYWAVYGKNHYKLVDLQVILG